MSDDDKGHSDPSPVTMQVDAIIEKTRREIAEAFLIGGRIFPDKKATPPDDGSTE